MLRVGSCGNHLCKIGPGESWDSVLPFLEMKHRMNLISLFVDFYEQIDGKQLAELCASTPTTASFKQVPSMNAGPGSVLSPFGTPLDAYCRIMHEPAQTVIAASTGWPQCAT